LPEPKADTVNAIMPKAMAMPKRLMTHTKGICKASKPL
jgi:hypothetical protein